MKKESFYFSHDYNAANDVKCLFLRQQLGMEGYGIFWYLIESLAASSGSLPLKIIPVLAMQMQVTEPKVSAVIQNFELFTIDGDHFFSLRLNEHLNLRKTLSIKGKEGAETRWGNRGANRGAIGDANGRGNAKERKGKEIKEKEINIPFDSFWDLYDKKEDRKKCEGKWEALTNEERDKIMQVLPDYIKSTPDPKYRKNPLTFFNGHSWEDEAMQDRNKVLHMGKLLKAVSVDENDMIHYDNGKVYACPSFHQMEDYRKGKADISIFDRKVS